jgi:hypothetical protein
MSVHDADKELGFGHLKVWPSLLLLHKVGEMLRIPRSLRLIKHRDPLNRRLRRDQIAIPEMHDVLHEAFHFPGGIRLLARFSSLSQLRMLIARECLAQHLYQGTVAR